MAIESEDRLARAKELRKQRLRKSLRGVENATTLSSTSLQQKSQNNEDLKQRKKAEKIAAQQAEQEKAKQIMRQNEREKQLLEDQKQAAALKRQEEAAQRAREEAKQRKEREENHRLRKEEEARVKAEHAAKIRAIQEKARMEHENFAAQKKADEHKRAQVSKREEEALKLAEAKRAEKIAAQKKIVEQKRAQVAKAKEEARKLAEAKEAEKLAEAKKAEKIAAQKKTDEQKRTQVAKFKEEARKLAEAKRAEKIAAQKKIEEKKRAQKKQTGTRKEQTAAQKKIEEQKRAQATLKKVAEAAMQANESQSETPTPKREVESQESSPEGCMEVDLTAKSEVESQESSPEGSMEVDLASFQRIASAPMSPKPKGIKIVSTSSSIHSIKNDNEDVVEIDSDIPEKSSAPTENKLDSKEDSAVKPLKETGIEVEEFHKIFRESPKTEKAANMKSKNPLKPVSSLKNPMVDASKQSRKKKEKKKKSKNNSIQGVSWKDLDEQTSNTHPRRRARSLSPPASHARYVDPRAMEEYEQAATMMNIPIDTLLRSSEPKVDKEKQAAVQHLRSCEVDVLDNSTIDSVSVLSGVKIDRQSWFSRLQRESAAYMSFLCADVGAANLYDEKRNPDVPMDYDFAVFMDDTKRAKRGRVVRRMSAPENVENSFETDNLSYVSADSEASWSTVNTGRSSEGFDDDASAVFAKHLNARPNPKVVVKGGHVLCEV